LTKLLVRVPETMAASAAALALLAPAICGAQDGPAPTAPTSILDQPIDVGPNSKVGSGARRRQKVASTAIGMLSGLVGGRGGGDSPVGSSGPQTLDCRIHDKDLTVFSDPSGVSLGVAAREVKGQVRVFAKVMSSPDKGTFQTAFMHDRVGENAGPRDVGICSLWGEWNLSVSWTKTSYVNDQMVSQASGGWSRAGEFVIPGTATGADHPDGLWRRLGFSNASYGARELQIDYPESHEGLTHDPVDLIIHVTRPARDPVDTTPFHLRLRKVDDHFEFEKASAPLPPPAPDVAPPPAPASSPPPAASPPPDAAPAPASSPPLFVAGDWAEGEVVIEVATGTTADQISKLDRRDGVKLLEQFDSTLLGATFLRSKIVDGSSVEAKVKALSDDKVVLSAQANYLFALQAPRGQTRTIRGEDVPLQYALLKMRLPEAQRFARGDKVLVAVIDTGVDAGHPELKGAIEASLDALGGPQSAPGHGTGVAGAIVAHGKLLGAAPDARLLAVRAFDPASSKGMSFHILKGLDWSVAKGARVVNMSFAGPQDPDLHRGIEKAYLKGVVLIAAAGNAGPKSPPLYPGADPRVIAVTATDARDRLYSAANRGTYIAVAAPGVEVLEASPQGGYQLQSGTSFSAAEVSGVAALMLERRPQMTPDEVRATLVSTSLALHGEPGQERLRLVDAFKAVSAPR
jgi:hypothetical protein